MAPQYRPVSVSLNGLPPEVFGAPKDFTFMDAMKEEEALQASQQTNQSNQMVLQQKQGMIDALREKYATQDPTTLDQGDVLNTAKGISMKNGDLGSMLDIIRAERSYATTDRQLTEEEALQLGVEPGTPLSVARAILRSRDLEQEQERFDDPTRVLNRQLDATLKDQRATGTQIRPPTPQQVQKIGAGDAFIAQMEDMEATYIPYISQNRGTRFLEAAVNTNSPESRLYGELNLAAKQAALSLEDRVTDQDYKTIQDIATVQALDTNETVIDRMQRLKDFIKRRNAADLNAMSAGGFNASGLQNRGQFQLPSTAPSQSGGLPRNEDGSPLTREQFLSQRGR